MASAIVANPAEFSGHGTCIDCVSYLVSLLRKPSFDAQLLIIINAKFNYSFRFILGKHGFTHKVFHKSMAIYSLSIDQFSIQ